MENWNGRESYRKSVKRIIESCTMLTAYRVRIKLDTIERTGHRVISSFESEAHIKQYDYQLHIKVFLSRTKQSRF